MEKASGTVRDSRGAVHKRLQEMQKKKIARPDDVRKAHDNMGKLTEKGQKEVKDLFEAAKKALEQTWATYDNDHYGNPICSPRHESASPY